jgi:hypothetical protein
MKEFLKNNFVVLLAFILPILLIIVVALSAYLPSLFLSTKYNFVYTSCFDGKNYYSYDCNSYLKNLYSVVDDKLVINSSNPIQKLNEEVIPTYTDRIFLHDTEKNESREITLNEAKTLTLNNLLTSPDGVTVSGYYSRSGGEFFLFDGGHSSYGYYLMKGRSKTKLNLINSTDQYYYQNNFQFVGWVLPGGN